MTVCCPRSDRVRPVALLTSFTITTLATLLVPLSAAAQNTDKEKDNSCRYAKQISQQENANASDTFTPTACQMRNQINHEANQNKHTLEYSEARRAIYFDVDIRHTQDGVPFILSAYSNHKIFIKDNQMPDPENFNIEHTWPQSQLKKYTSYDQTKSDLYHLYAVESRINSERGSYPFCNVGGESKPQSKEAQQDDLAAHPENREGKLGDRCFEPPEDQKGMVARAMFYMAIAYNLPINDDQEGVLRQWNKKVPVSDFEMERARKIEEIQGNINPFIQNPTLVDHFSNF